MTTDPDAADRCSGSTRDRTLARCPGAGPARFQLPLGSDGAGCSGPAAVLGRRRADRRSPLQGWRSGLRSDGGEGSPAGFPSGSRAVPGCLPRTSERCRAGRDRCVPPRRRSTRSLISAAALLVNVRPRAEAFSLSSSSRTSTVREAGADLPSREDKACFGNDGFAGEGKCQSGITQCKPGTTCEAASRASHGTCTDRTWER